MAAGETRCWGLYGTFERENVIVGFGGRDGGGGGVDTDVGVGDDGGSSENEGRRGSTLGEDIGLGPVGGAGGGGMSL